MSKIALITGASSGIGYACAIELASHGYDLILNARRAERIDELAVELKNKYGVKIYKLIFDVRMKEQVFEGIASIPAPFAAIDVLINNAGLAAGLSDLHDGDTEDWDRMIDTNVKGLVYVSKAVIPGMIERMSGHIINIGSIAGRETYQKGNVYCATKHAVASLTKGMRMELVNHGIKVTQVSPGAAETEFSEVRFRGDKERAKKVYEGFTPLTADDVARCVGFCVNLPAHVNIDDMLVMATAQASASLISRKNQSD